MIKPGMFISERYEIIDKVGSGGMADVYKAKCHRLNRYVAIKILKSEFSSDTGFVQKFRAEAQSVAGLSHPNIVSVYDVGDDDGLYYIVMELVEGITLKRFIERKKMLDVKEAVGITIQIAQGMEAAHNHHIIHRDIKPQNIIISREGKVKVADFGIAKAATSNTISQNAVGSVHYLSPEQARGGYSDERSDIYSLGVTLYEMLTGQVPFSGDNSVSVALSHIQNEATPVQVLNPEIPTSVDRIVQKCMQKKPERRYQTAQELIRDLKQSLLNPEGDFVTISSSATVSDSPTRNMTSEELDSIKNAAKKQPARSVEHSIQEKEPASAAKSPAVHYSNAKSSHRKPKKIRKEDEELDAMDSTLEKVLTVVSVIFAVALIAVILYLLKQFVTGDSGSLFSGNKPTTEAVTNAPVQQDENIPTTGSDYIKPKPSPTPTPAPTPTGQLSNMVPIPLVVGLTIDDAVKELKRVSEEFEIDYTTEEYSDEYDQGIISAQYPPKDIMVERNATIKLTVSAGKEVIAFEGVDNMTYDDAVRYLSSFGLTVSSILHEFSDTVPKDSIIRTEPGAGEMVEKEGSVTVYISDGPENPGNAVPNVIGVKISNAKKQIKNAGLSVGEITYVYSDIYPADQVCYQSMPVGTMLEPGAAVDLQVSMGSQSAAIGGDTGDEGTDDPGEGSSDGPVG